MTEETPYLLKTIIVPNGLLTAQYSITYTSNVLQLVNDVLSPGVNYYYGTDGSGVKGWYILSSSGGGVTEDDLFLYTLSF